MIKPSKSEKFRRIVATACLTFTAAIFWAFVLAALIRFAFGIEDQDIARTVIVIAAPCIGVVLLPKVWRMMADH